MAAALGALTLAHSSHALAQTGIGLKPQAQLPEVVVTGNPLGSDLFDLVSHASVLGGEGLLLRRKSTLGETIGELPGVSSSNYGPNASRPVIRGLDGDRIRILHNGLGMLDASSAGPDHAVAVDPLIVDRIEVVRGPAALLYGGSAVGGVVNVIDNRIPQSPLQGFSGNAEARFGRRTRTRGRRSSGRRQRQSGAARRRIWARNRRPPYPRPRALQPPARERLRVRTVGERDRSRRPAKVDLAGEVRDLGRAINGVKFKLARTDYRHEELESGVVGTTFMNRGYKARIEALHGNVGPLKGAVACSSPTSTFRPWVTRHSFQKPAPMPKVCSCSKNGRSASSS